MSTPPSRRRVILAATLVLLIGITRVQAQRPTVRSQSPTVQSRRPTVVDTGQVPTDQVLLAHLRTLRFTHDHVTSDQRPLDWRNVSLGAARIEPEASPIRVRLPRGGRIVARIVNLGEPVRRFALARKGTTYVWFQDDHDPPYAIYISTDSSGQIIDRARVRLSVATDHPPRLGQPIARWIFASTDSTTAGVTPPLQWAAALCSNRCITGPWCTGDSILGMTR